MYDVSLGLNSYEALFYLLHISYLHPLHLDESSQLASDDLLSLEIGYIIILISSLTHSPPVFIVGRVK